MRASEACLRAAETTEILLVDQQSQREISHHRSSVPTCMTRGGGAYPPYHSSGPPRGGTCMRLPQRIFFGLLFPLCITCDSITRILLQLKFQKQTYYLQCSILSRVYLGIHQNSFEFHQDTLCIGCHMIWTCLFGALHDFLALCFGTIFGISSFSAI